MNAGEMSVTDSDDILNKIASELVCKLSLKLPDDPVVAHDGCIYERRELVSNSDSGDCKEYKSCSQIKRVIELLLSSGKIDDEFIKSSVDDAQEKDTNAHNYSYIRTKAEDGDTDSMIKLAELYLSGEGVDQDEKASYRWFEKASENDCDTGTARVGDCLLSGLGVEQDYQEGYMTLIESANEGGAPAALRLYHYYDTGILGFNQDSVKADRYLNRLKTISPDLSDENIQQMKLELSELITLPSSSVKKEQSEEGTRPTGNSETKDDAMPNSGKAEDQSETLLKQCYACNASKPKEDYSSTQWKQPLKTGRCKECCKGETNSSSTTKVKFSDKETSEVKKSDTCEVEKSSTPDKQHNPNDSIKTEEDQSQSQGNVKQCYECKQSKQQMEFTASQWKKRMGTGRCFECVSKTVQWQSSSIKPTLQTKICCECKEKKPHFEFSPNQWRMTTGTGRCKPCVQQKLQQG